MATERVIHLQNRESGIEVASNVGVDTAVRLLARYFDRTRMRSELPEKFYIPDQPVLQEDANEYGITGNGDLMGGVILNEHHAGKSVLHEGIGAQIPDWHNAEFASSMEGAVLPGYTFFNTEGADAAFDELDAQGVTGMRLKDPRGTGGMHQSMVYTKEELHAALEKEYARVGDLAEYGAVLEVGLENPREIIIGSLTIGEQEYAYYGRHHARAGSGPKTILTIVKGGFERLLDRGPSKEINLSIRQAIIAKEGYGEKLGATTDRMVFDVVHGCNNGRNHYGITDTTMRVAGIWHAEIAGVNMLATSGSSSAVLSTGKIRRPRNSWLGREDCQHMYEYETWSSGRVLRSPAGNDRYVTVFALTE